MLKSALDLIMGGTEQKAPPTKGRFSPQNFNQYIGQEKAKALIGRYIDATLERDMTFPHLLLHGGAGMGKTTFVKLTARALGVKYRELITSEIEDFEEILMLIDEVDGGILFMDEIHGLDRANAEKLYSIMQDFEYNGMAIAPFTLVGATTELGEIIQNRKPFYDRFKIVIELVPYTQDELVKMAQQYQEEAFPADSLPTETLEIIAQNCRNTPRKLLSLTESTIYFGGDYESVLDTFNIIKRGFTAKDLILLKFLSMNEKGVGLQALCSYLDLSQKTYIYDQEPFLLRSGLIQRTSRGRKITDVGEKMIRELEAA